MIAGAATVQRLPLAATKLTIPTKSGSVAGSEVCTASLRGGSVQDHSAYSTIYAMLTAHTHRGHVTQAIINSPRSVPPSRPRPLAARARHVSPSRGRRSPMPAVRPSALHHPVLSSPLPCSLIAALPPRRRCGQPRGAAFRAIPSGNRPQSCRPAATRSSDRRRARPAATSDSISHRCRCSTDP